MRKESIKFCIAFIVVLLIFVSGALVYKKNTKNNSIDDELNTNLQSEVKMDNVKVEKTDQENDVNQKVDEQKDISLSQVTVVSQSPQPANQERTLFILKDVGEPYMANLGLAPSDFTRIKNAGFDIIQGNFDICETPSNVLLFLESAHDAGLRVILPAGSGEAEWGYECDSEIPLNQKPVWQKDKVQKWVNILKFHPAIFGWDISNEAGGNFPNANQRNNDNWQKDFGITTGQLQDAYRDVKAVDSNRPVIIRMNGWYFYDQDYDYFRAGNPFGKGVADIVMVNAYSNVDEYFTDFVATVMSRAQKSIHAIDPNVKFIVSLGVWEEAPLWFEPTRNELENDMRSASQVEGSIGIAFFKYGAENSEWWLPSRQNMWSLVQEVIKKY